LPAQGTGTRAFRDTRGFTM